MSSLLHPVHVFRHECLVSFLFAHSQTMPLTLTFDLIDRRVHVRYHRRKLLPLKINSLEERSRPSFFLKMHSDISLLSSLFWKHSPAGDSRVSSHTYAPVISLLLWGLSSALRHGSRGWPPVGLKWLFETEMVDVLRKSGAFSWADVC